MKYREDVFAAMNAKQAERRLRSVLERKREIVRPGGVLRHLAEEISVHPTRANQDLICNALISLERKREIVLGRDEGAKFVQRVSYVGPPAPNKSFDDQSKEVDVVDEAAENDGTSNGQTANVTEPDASQQGIKQLAHLTSYVERANGCLSVLTELADSEGVGTDLSVQQVLREFTDLNLSQVDYVKRLIRFADCITTKSLGRGRSSYMLNLAKPTVLEAEWEQFKERWRTTKPTDTQTDQEVTEVDDPPAHTYAATTLDLDEQLTQLVEDQAAALVQLGEERAALVAECDMLKRQLEHKTAAEQELETVRSQLDAVNNELITFKQEKAARDERARELVSRYRS